MPGDADPQLLVQNFGAPLRMLDPGVGFKLYPCNGFTQRPIDASLALRDEHKIRAADIERVEITHPRFDYVNRPQPKSGLDAKFSVQYTTLVALLDGEVTIDTFTDARLFAPDIAALLPKVHFRADDTIPLDKAKLHIIVTVWLKDGREVSKMIDNKVTGWLGSKGNPPTREQRLKKFFACTRHVLRQSAAERMLTLVEQLETLPDVLEIMDIARCERAAA
jgi:2-methylcitrate dehydratase PrpD